ncbi:diacylglycerol kinase (plasmid) [Klebsiella pneumoniae]|uniref:Diacylglycerol kinase n=2 Tax=Klebsiella/Raoultella group TaxID=2890311 RepID=A0A2U7XWW1_KLEPN|nr:MULTISPECIES: diacylglycerol kinase [Enterobacteriaceae]HBR2080380.1 diacylglycerol kinase [Klebsiella quasipneumoniae subsp. quasipneumoniae]AVX52228.1 Diacylglycerol kinase [Klebsiella pneumoniae]AZZ88829.1 Diacylglycerol kinase [Raoultella ornithinolytica]EIX9211799.1 diacylglycerol kinase [Klebsiella pneumoniae]EIX9212196.1 diacylglycerol kinase [Klebsiella pneumoniae]
MQQIQQGRNRKFPHSKTGVKRIIGTAIYSWDGFIAAFRSEAAFRQLLIIHGILIIASFFLNVNSVEQALMLAVCLISLLVELLNSAIEATIDRISLEIHPLSKKAKDMGSAAQTFALITVAIVWGVLLY